MKNATHSTRTGPVRGIASNDPIGQTAGVAVVRNNAGIEAQFRSSSAGNVDIFLNSDSPILTIAMPIAANMPVGWLFPLSIDTANSLWTDANGQPYPQEVGDGQLTIGGTLAIRDVVPGGGLQPAGTRISIFGMGFTPAARVNMEGVNLSAGDVQFISPSQIDVVLSSALQMDGTRVRVRTRIRSVPRICLFAHTANRREHTCAGGTELSAFLAPDLFQRNFGVDAIRPEIYGSGATKSGHRRG